MSFDLSLTAAQTKDSADRLSEKRALFHLPDDLIYLDGNSLGPLPKTVPDALSHCLTKEWGDGLIRSWNEADWISLPETIAGQIAPLIGAQQRNVIVADSTSINLFKVLSVACAMRASRPKIVTETSNFPTDSYIAEGVLKQMALSQELVRYDSSEALIDSLDDSVAVVLLSHIHYRTGRLLDMEKITKAAHQAGALIIWDLAHSAGATVVELDRCQVDFAVGCSYKYLNGGPGAPAYLYVADRHLGQVTQPLSGWFAHRAPFAFEPSYAPATDIKQYLCGTPPVLSMIALREALRLWDDVDIAALRQKSLGLTDYFVALMTARCADHGLTLLSPVLHEERGSQIAYRHHSSGYAMISALGAAGVIGDFRAPDILRFGFAPLYNSYCDVWHAVDKLATILTSRSWDQPQFHARKMVT